MLSSRRSNPERLPTKTTGNPAAPTRRVAVVIAAVMLAALTTGAALSVAGPSAAAPAASSVEAVAPPPAEARTERRARGWVLAPVASVSGTRVNTIYGQRCAASQFGKYRMVAGLTDRGRQSAWSFGLKVTRNGARHAITGLSFTAYTPNKVRKQVRRIFARTTFRYLDQGGTPYLQGVTRDGRQQSLIPFRTKRGACR